MSSMFDKITKTKARALYAEHKDFIMVPSNLRPDSFAAITVNARNFCRMINAPFDTMVNNFRYYNCTSKETGRTVAFYTKTE